MYICSSIGYSVRATCMFTCSISRFDFILRMHQRWRWHNWYRHWQLHPLVMHTIQIINILSGRAHNAAINAARTTTAANAATASTDARTGTAARTRSGSRSNHAHWLRCGTGRRRHIMMCIRMRMRHIIIACVTQWCTPGQCIVCRLYGWYDSTATEYIR